MKLQVGERLPGSGPAGQPGGYLIAGIVHETPWMTLYAARKILYNFDFANERCRETDEKEWLDVLLRVCHNSDPETLENVRRRRALVRDEVRVVLANRASTAWPEPVDLLEVPASGEALTARDDEEREPIVVLSRPHGLPLTEWTRGTTSLSHRLALVAELLAFVSGAQREGLLLHTLAPEALVVDPQGRLGYLGSDGVLRQEQGQLANGVWPLADLFPAERYARGYAAPECFDAARPRDARTDWFSAAAVAYFALTGDVADQPGQADPSFEWHARHAERLAGVLRGADAGAVRAWSRSLGADAEKCLAAWPGNLVRVVQRALAHDPEDRPASLGELLEWLASPPPPAPLAALALRLPGGSALRIHYELPISDTALDVFVERCVAADNGHPAKTTTAATGPATGWIETAALPDDAAATYRVRLRVRGDPGQPASAAIVASVADPTPRFLRQFAESAAVANPGGTEPPAISLLFRAVKWTGVADALLASTLPPVRAWATARVADAMKLPANAAEAEPLLWRALQDNDVQVRKLATAGWLSGTLTPPRVTRLFEELARRPVAESRDALQQMHRRGAEASIVRLAEEAAAAAKTASCPECGAAVPQRDLAAHLQAVHDYLEVDGAMLPRAVALAQLWDSVFAEGDRAAHQRLCQMLLPAASGSPPPYIASLTAELARRGDGLLASRWQELPRLTQCLRSEAAAVPFFAPLMRSADPRVREIGRELVLAELTSRLAGVEVTALHVRAQVEALCPPEQLEDAIELCRALPRAGIKAEPVRECLRQLEQQRPVACSVCHALVPGSELETHLRRAHHVYQFRGKTHSLQAMLGVLLDNLCDRRPDRESWVALETITREEYPAEAEGYLATWLGQNLARQPAGQRDHRTGVAAEAIAAGVSGQRMAMVLAGLTDSTWQAAAFQLALEIAVRLPVPLPPAVLAAVQPRLADRRLPAELRLRSAAHLLRTTGSVGAAAVKLLRFLVASPSKTKNIERLHALEQLTGKMPVIDQLVAEIEDQVRMSCPRCGNELRRVEMIQHLWKEHRLMLDGRRVREPWRVIEDWLEDYRVEGDADALERCRRLADQLDAREGRSRLQRLMLQHGIEDNRLRGALLRQAQERNASLCPHCYALVPVADLPLPPPLIIEPDLIEGEGYRVETSDHGVIPTLDIEIPAATVYSGREPGRLLTRLGALVFFAFPLLVLTVLLLAFPPPLDLAWFLPGAMIGGVFLFVIGMIFLAWDSREDPLNRIVDHAWGRLVPELLHLGLARDDHAFLAALAQCSIGHGDIAARADVLERIRKIVDDRVSNGPVAASYLGALWRLTVEDGAEDEDQQDTLPILAAQADRCFDGRLPLSFLSTLLAPLENETWSVADERRLRVLMCQRAFHAGLEVRELLELGRLHGTLGRALDVEHADYIAHLRLLRTLQPSRPWERVGKARTIFEIVQNPEDSEPLLERFQDLLLRVDNVPDMYICARGMQFENAWILEPPQQIDIINRTLFEEGGYHLVIGNYRFWYADEPTQVVARLEKWFRFFFREFRPQLATVYRSRAPVAAQRLLARNGVRCPDCRRRVLPVPGELGITSDPPRREEGVVVALPG